MASGETKAERRVRVETARLVRLCRKHRAAYLDTQDQWKADQSSFALMTDVCRALDKLDDAEDTIKDERAAATRARGK